MPCLTEDQSILHEKEQNGVVSHMGNPAVAKRDGKQYSQPTKEGHTPARKAPFEERGHKPSAREEAWKWREALHSAN